MEVSFIANEAIEWFHETIRFGHGKDISRVFLGAAEFEDYVRGVIILAIFVLAFLFIWLVALLILRFLGHKNVGFFSGQKMIQKKRNFENRLFMKCNMSILVRSLFTLCALNILIFCGIAVTKGSFHLDSTIFSFQSSIVGVEELLVDSLDVLDVAINTAIETQSLCNRADELFKDFCPIPNRNEVFGIDFDAKKISISFEEIADVAIEQGKLAKPQMEKVHETLIVTDEALTLTSTFKELSAYYVLLVSFLCASLISGTLLATAGYTSRYLERIQIRVLVPLLLFISVVVWLLSSVFGTIGVVASDFCLGGKYDGSPNDSIYDIMKLMNLHEADYDIYNIIKFYIEGCNAKDPLGIIHRYIPIIHEAESKVLQFLLSVDNMGLKNVSEVCMHDVTEAVDIVRDLEAIIKTTKMLADRSISIGECPRINSIYVEAIHNGACTSLPWASLWIFFSLLIIGICGMMMVTLRSSILEHSKVFSIIYHAPTVDDDTDYDDTDFDGIVRDCADNDSVMVQHDYVHDDRDLVNFIARVDQISEHAKLSTLIGNISNNDDSGDTNNDAIMGDSNVNDTEAVQHDLLHNKSLKDDHILRNGDSKNIAAVDDAKVTNAFMGVRNEDEYSAMQRNHMHSDCERDNLNSMDKGRGNISTFDNVTGKSSD